MKASKIHGSGQKMGDRSAQTTELDQSLSHLTPHLPHAYVEPSQPTLLWPSYH